MSETPEKMPIRVRPSELASAFLPLLLVAYGLYVTAELVWACFQLILVLGAASLVALFVSRLAVGLESRTGLPLRYGSVLVLATVSLVVIFFLFLAGSQIATQFGQLVTDIPALTARWQKALESNELTRGLADFLRQGSQGVQPSMVFGNMRGLFSSAVGFGAALVFFVAVSFYLSVDPRTYRRGFLALFKNPQRKRQVYQVLNVLGDQMWQFLLGQLATMTVLAILTTLGLWALGIPSYLALGLLAGGLAFIPLIGPTLAFLPALLVASTEGTTAMLSVIALYGGIQFLEGNFLTPLIQRHMTSIPPVVLMTTQAMMGLLFGMFGVALAAPVAIAGMVLVEELYLKDSGKPPSERTVAVMLEPPPAAPDHPAPTTEQQQAS